MTRKQLVTFIIAMSNNKLDRLQPSRSVTHLAWRPSLRNNAVVEADRENRQLAVVSDDSSLRLFSLSGFA